MAAASIAIATMSGWSTTCDGSEPYMEMTATADLTAGVMYTIHVCDYESGTYYANYKFTVTLL
jgi:hypothetical protein